MANRQCSSNAYGLNLDALPPILVPKMSLPLLFASSSAMLGCKDNSQPLHGNCISQPQQEEAHVQWKPGEKCPPWRAGPDSCHWLDPASSLGAYCSHLSSLSLTLGGDSGTGWPRHMTTSLPGSSPSSHTLAWDFRLLGLIPNPLCLPAPGTAVSWPPELLGSVQHTATAQICGGQACDLGC